MASIAEIRETFGKVLPRGMYERLRQMGRKTVGRAMSIDYEGRSDFFRKAFLALRFNGIDGDYFEFGSHGCSTFRMAHDYSRRWGHACRLWAFDSFQGLPPTSLPEDEHPRWVKGEMATQVEYFHYLCKVGKIPRDQYEVWPGFYSESLVKPEAAGLPTNVALAYIDCDLYSSTKDVLAFLRPRLKHGMMIAFDDYFCYSSNRDSGNRAAAIEFFGENTEFELVDYMNYGWFGKAYIVYRADLAGTRRDASRQWRQSVSE